jgi:hypothetical protein
VAKICTRKLKKMQNNKQRYMEINCKVVQTAENGAGPDEDDSGNKPIETVMLLQEFGCEVREGNEL